MTRPTSHLRGALRLAAVVLTTAALLAACTKASTSTTTGSSSHDSGALSSSGSSGLDSGALASGHDSSKSESSKQKVVDAANAACETYYDSYLSALADLDTKYRNNTQSYAAGLIAAVVKASSTRLNALKALTPPKALQEGWSTMLSRLEDMQKNRETAQQAVANSDPDAYQAAGSQNKVLTPKFQAAAGNLGLDVCAANGISSSDASAITKVLKTTGVNNDPSFCTKQFTAGFDFQNWGSVAACKSDQSSPATITSVSVSNIQGGGDYATVDVTATTNDGTTETGSATMSHLSGHWQIEALSLQPQGGPTS